MGRNDRIEEELRRSIQSLEVSLGRAIEISSLRHEAVTSLYRTLPIDIPLPPFVGYAMKPEVCAALVTEILVATPDVVLELGSGLSTVVAAYALRQAGKGHLVSLEHDAAYHSATLQLLTDRGLTDLVTLLLSPLAAVPLDEGTWQWYDLPVSQLPDSIDLLVIDGPQADLQPLSRFPALPLIWPRCKPDVSVLVDDAGRDEERTILQKWLERYTDLVVEPIPSEQGALWLRRIRNV